ncbi:hypothetical protein Pse7367_0717 [Thalassoporum mexicanum PCC 7367]|uniref:hypothetical protein n=1 Tax=Thalassoporum mexicanum TaxID=3457544 RepID=UPI00029FA4F7|nr:hypothetical protein [Pseudanabaena sp. PCC 7367]AFY69019.1 hypothetical protein Pse7367_0717 [Pseudanabaena sp. PCC 7367]
MTKIYQIVPLLPPAFSGIGDYAISLAQNLRNFYGIESIFIVGDPDWQGANEIDRFSCYQVSDRSAQALAELIHNLTDGLTTNTEPLPRSATLQPDQLAKLDQASNSSQSAQANQPTILLHYVGYGYQQRGIPFWLSDWLKQNTNPIADQRFKIVTMFHEVYSAGPPWRSEFWLRPWQVQIAKRVIAASSSIFVSNYLSAEDISKHLPQNPHNLTAANINIYPIWSSFGEPSLAELNLVDRQPTRWLICGGTAMLERGLTSFLQVLKYIPAEFAPTHLDLIGGKENPAIAQLSAQLQAQSPDLTIAYYPQIEVAKASSLFAQATFAWIHYLRPKEISPSLVFKSTVFASCSAHGVLSVFSHQETGTTINNDPHPGVFYITIAGSTRVSFPTAADLPAIRQKVYQWYHRHASAKMVAKAYADACEIDGDSR